MKKHGMLEKPVPCASTHHDTVVAYILDTSKTLANQSKRALGDTLGVDTRTIESDKKRTSLVVLILEQQARHHVEKYFAL